MKDGIIHRELTEGCSQFPGLWVGLYIWSQCWWLRSRRGGGGGGRQEERRGSGRGKGQILRAHSCDLEKKVIIISFLFRMITTCTFGLDPICVCT